MQYSCSSYNARFSGNDGLLLALLPPHVQLLCYPVNPKYAQKGARFHLNLEVSQDLEDMMLTYANADLFLRKNVQSEVP
jgi:hypothetical protein